MASAQSDLQSGPPRGRYTGIVIFAAFIGLYAVIMMGGKPATPTALIINDIAWTAVSLFATVECYRAASQLTGRERRAWRWIAAGCFAWFLGQCVWDYHEWVIGQLPPFPHWMQLLYAQYPLWLIVGLFTLPKPSGAGGLSLRLLCNLGLLVCALAIILIIAITEPSRLSSNAERYAFTAVMHGGLYPIACISSLYLLWGYRWQKAHWPLVLIAGGQLFHSAAFISYVHDMMIGSYQPANWWQIAWLLSFAATACAAREYAWTTKHGYLVKLPTLLARERWVEAIMPAMMGIAIASVAALNIDWLSPRVIYSSAVVGCVFAVLLGIREASIQREEYALIEKLNDSNDKLLSANRDLKDSEQQVRTLNAQLEQRVAERTFALESTYRELESFSYAVAHDIKAPLRAINSFAALLAEETGSSLNERAQSHIKRVRHGALHMSQLVDDLLAYARIERVELQTDTVELDALIRECIGEHEEAIAHARCEVSVHAEPLTVHADRAALALALRNLLQNAIKFSRDSHPPRITITVQRVSGAAQIEIRDNGIGFDMQYHDKIFQLFQRLHRADQFSGTGIGLAIARKAVERMGGKVWAESKLGEGAAFFIQLPV